MIARPLRPHGNPDDKPLLEEARRKDMRATAVPESFHISQAAALTSG